MAASASAYGAEKQWHHHRNGHGNNMYVAWHEKQRVAYQRINNEWQRQCVMAAAA